MKDKIEWLRQRQLGIGGSDCAAVLGVSEWKTPLQIWNNKTCKTVIEQKENDKMYFGKQLEPFVLKEYVKRSGNECIANTDYHMFKSKKYPWLLATIDAHVVDKPLLVEIKTTGFFNKNWGEPGTDQIPIEYLLQCAHYCLIVSEFKPVNGIDIAALGATSDFRIYHYKRNERLEECIINVTHNFWHKYVLQGEEPPITYNDNARMIYEKAIQDTVKIATPEVIELHQKLVSLKQNLKSSKKCVEDIENQIQLFMENNEVLIDIGGKKLVTWKNQERKILDTKRIKETDLELYKKYTKKSESRVFKIF